MTDNVLSFVVTSPEHHPICYGKDERVNKRLRALFDHSTLMRWSIVILCPFLHNTHDAKATRTTPSLQGRPASHKTRAVPRMKCSANTQKKTPHITPAMFNQSLDTYGVVYAYMLPIAITQSLLILHCNDKQKSENILCSVVQLFGVDNSLPRMRCSRHQPDERDRVIQCVVGKLDTKVFPTCPEFRRVIERKHSW